MIRRLVRLFRRFQRPLAWSLLGLSLIAFVTIMASIWKVPDKPSAALAALVLLWQGIEAVLDVESDESS